MCVKYQSSHYQAPGDTLRAEVKMEMKVEVDVAVMPVNRSGRASPLS